MRLPFSVIEQKDFDAVGFGLNAVDHLIVVPEYPAFDTKTDLLSTNDQRVDRRHPRWWLYSAWD